MSDCRCCADSTGHYFISVIVILLLIYCVFAILYLIFFVTIVMNEDECKNFIKEIDDFCFRVFLKIQL